MGVVAAFVPRHIVVQDVEQNRAMLHVADNEIQPAKSRRFDKRTVERLGEYSY